MDDTPKDGRQTRTILHASCVEIAGRGLLITGPSGSGKSSIALDLIALGASLVADDRVVVLRDGDTLRAASPESIAGLIEARFLGLLQMPYTENASVVAVLDLNRTETQRLPPGRHTEILGLPVTLLYRPSGMHVSSAVLHVLRWRRVDP